MNGKIIEFYLIFGFLNENVRKVPNLQLTLFFLFRRFRSINRYGFYRTIRKTNWQDRSSANVKIIIKEWSMRNRR